MLAIGALGAGCTLAPPVEDSGRPAAAPAAGGAAATAPQPAAAVVPPPPTAAPPPPPPVLAFDEAVANAAHAVFTNAPAPDSSAAMVVIDPLVDGMTGYQSAATQSIQDRIVGIVKRDFPNYAVPRITPESLRQQPRVLVGTFTPVNAQMKTTGERDA